MASAVGLASFFSSCGFVYGEHNTTHTNGEDGLSFVEAAEAAIHSLNRFYNTTEGRWSPDSAWWLSGYALQDILDYMYKTGSRRYMQLAYHTIELQKDPLPWWPQGDGYFRADSTDDTGWWCVPRLSMYPYGSI